MYHFRVQVCGEQRLEHGASRRVHAELIFIRGERLSPHYDLVC